MAEKQLKFSVGLEVHARLNTEHKIFCSCLNRYGDGINSNTCPVCLGLPGSLPVFNQEVLRPALKAALAMDCQIPNFSEFSRKNYFYPDLPRNFQITQYEHPLALGGHLKGGSAIKPLKVRLERIHLEEDAGRSLKLVKACTEVDFNRAGAPLIEIVTMPDLKSGEEARKWLNRLRQLLRWLDVCDGDMEKGSLRCDANVGLSGQGPLAGPWVELKNLNSFKAVSLAVDFEIIRLKNIIGTQGTLRRETRCWNSGSRTTSLLRKKESAAEYRYFPEPDLPRLETDSELLLDLALNQPELPIAKENRFQKIYGLSVVNSITICRSLILANYFESCMSEVSAPGVSKTVTGHLVCNWILGPVLNSAQGNDENLEKLKLDPPKLAKIVEMQVLESLGKSVARKVICDALAGNIKGDILEEIRSLVEKSSISSSELKVLCDEAVDSNANYLNAYLNGKSKLLNYFVGWVMSRAGHCADAGRIREMILLRLKDKQDQK